ncbi:hypothetical protein BC830DRAFT_1172703 [Chytriomyces sp. MP71]|nr:hypothetical protein BC830DRAFT_1172703 [Chytriomyces sp. MP71]
MTSSSASSDPVTILVSVLILFFVLRYLLAAPENPDSASAGARGTAAHSQVQNGSRRRHVVAQHKAP